nr:MAG TPA: hypothetical protein [Caudoviricetes sp.]
MVLILLFAKFSLSLQKIYTYVLVKLLWILHC